MMQRCSVVLVLAFAGLLGCSGDEAPESSEPTFLDPQLKALEKAKGVEQMMGEASEARAHSLEELEK